MLDGLADLRLRGSIGTWTWDRWAQPAAFSTSTDAAIRRMEAALDLARPGARIQVWPTLIGHTACSDALWQAAANAAKARQSHWSFHMSPGANDGDYYRRQTGRDPLVHLDEIGVLDERAVVAHAIHVSDAEIEVLNRRGASVAFSPASSLQHASGVTRAGRHAEMRHVALGTDSPHRLPLLHAAGLVCSLYGDMHGDRACVLPERALEWLTLAGARALGAADSIGSLEIGKRADIAVFEVTRPLYNVANALVHHATTGRAVHVFIDGEHVVRDGHVIGEERILSEATEAAHQLGQRAGFPATTGWPLIE